MIRSAVCDDDPLYVKEIENCIANKFERLIYETWMYDEQFMRSANLLITHFEVNYYCRR